MTSTQVTAVDLQERVAERLIGRNPPSHDFFEREAFRIAAVSETMSSRFLNGGRLLAFGRGAASTDAQHVAVEFVHPVIVGKRALPAVDLSLSFTDWIPAVVRDADIVVGFAPPAGDRLVSEALQAAHQRGAFTLALPGSAADLAIASPSDDVFLAQELVEVLYHTLWETVHVFFEHRERRHEDVGASAFLYPFLGSDTQDTSSLTDEVAVSITQKAAEDERLRDEVASEQAGQIAEAIVAVGDRIRAGGTLLFLGNGGSATDANDAAIDCISGGRGNPVRALSLAMEPASLSAIANDIGREAMFLRQLIAHGRPGDVVVAISTSGGSANVIAALDEARRRDILTVALLGYDGGDIVRRRLADLPIVVRSDYIPRIQEVQASIYHVMVEAWRQ